MSKTISLFHVVFATKNREATLDMNKSEMLHRFIWMLLKEKKCYLYRVNSMPEHVHMFFDLHPSYSLSETVRDIKARSSNWMMSKKVSPIFKGWARGYYAASKSIENRDMVIDYVKNQQVHHVKHNFEDEIRELYKRNRLEWHDDDMR